MSVIIAADINSIGGIPNRTMGRGGGGGQPPASKVAQVRKKADGGGGGGGDSDTFFRPQHFGSNFQTQSRGTHCTSPTSLTRGGKEERKNSAGELTCKKGSSLQ